MAARLEWLRRIGRDAGAAWRQAGASLANLRRSLYHKRLPDFVVFRISGTLADLAPERPWWARFVPGMHTPQTIEGLHGALRRVAADPDVRGVLLLLQDAALKRTQAQNLAALFARFREWDRIWNAGAAPKTITVFLEQITASTYLAASAADRIVVTPLTTWEVMGLQIEAEYYRDALARIGVRAEVVRVAPWKTAADMLSEAQMSPAAREQYEWLLDSIYQSLVRAIATGRSLDEAAVRTLIDRAPLSAPDALEAGLVDRIGYEDELPALLGAPESPARLARYGKVRRLLFRRVPARSAQAIGVLDFSGSIMMGESRSLPLPIPLLGGATLGSSSVQQQVRAARKRSDLAAIVAYVDSPGGSALASDLMARELALLAREKPLVVYMGPTAASGGYYIATPANAIVAQESTLTGSIGVITAKLLTGEAYQNLGIGRDHVQRGANANLFSDAHPWTDDQRALVESGVEVIYTTFKQRVQEGRKLSAQAVAEVAGGKVWTGTQALAHGLIDATGDFRLAVESAARLAGMQFTPVTELRLEPVAAGRTRRLAQPAKAAAALLGLAAQPATPLLLLQSAWEAALRANRYWLVADGLPTLEE